MHAAAQASKGLEEQLLANDEREIAAFSREVNGRMREPLREQRAERVRRREAQRAEPLQIPLP